MGIIIGSFQGLIKKAGGAKSLLLTSPNGSESWISGSSHDITWESSKIAELDLYYSIDNGSNWLLIEEKVDAALGSYSWTIPVAISSTCLVKIIEYGGEIEDSSDAVFTIGFGAAVALYVAASAFEPAYFDACGSIASANILVQELEYHALANGSHGSNNADAITYKSGMEAVKILEANMGQLKVYGVDTNFSLLFKVKYTQVYGMDALGGSPSPYYAEHKPGGGSRSLRGVFYYAEGGSCMPDNTYNKANTTWYWQAVIWDYTNKKAYSNIYDLNGNLLQSNNAAIDPAKTLYSWSGRYFYLNQSPNNPVYEHIIYFQKVINSTDLANAVTWGNTY